MQKYKNNLIKPFYLSISYNNFSSKIKEVRVRFAPSPTGKLHIGGLRTAFYNYLFAKKYNGKYLLRIEDTDQDRIKENSISNIIESLRWAGIEADYGPHKKQSDDEEQAGGDWFQSKRLHLYHEHIEILLKSKKAYRCFCDENRLTLLRHNAAKRQEKIGYDGKCRNLSDSTIEKYMNENRKHVVRFKLDDKDIMYNDLTSGKHISNPGKQEGDFVILKSDGFPTYHFANVVDDHLMRISHVLRGQEWQLSTAKHIALYEAFNWKHPEYAHLPLICNKDGSKISKRQDDIDLLSFREKGYMPESILTYLTSIGGGSKVNILSDDSFFKSKNKIIDELVLNFDEKKINGRSVKLNQELLDNLNKKFLKLKLGNTKGKSELTLELKNLVEKKNFQKMNPNYFKNEYLENVIYCTQDRIYKLSDLVDNNEFAFLWTDMSNFNTETKSNISFNLILKLIDYLEEFLNRPNICLKNKDTLKKELTCIFDQIKMDSNDKKINFWHLTRLVIIGSVQGPSIFEIFNILGVDTLIYRLKIAKEFFLLNNK